jgi:hypothetical protein
MLMTHIRLGKFVALLIALPSVVEAGPPLICHPFQTEGGKLLAWGSGPGWNTPDPHYDLNRLTADTLALLDADAPVLARMENMRRAVIYASGDLQVAEQLLAAVLARATTPRASRLATFDAGYLIESFKQARHLFGRSITHQDGYAMVRRAIDMGAPLPELEFAAALMTEGAQSSAHMQRARAAVRAESLLAKNITNLRW